MTKKFVTLTAIFLFLVAIVIYFNSPAGQPLLDSLARDNRLLLPLITIAALVDSINPCAFSILFLTITFLFSLGKSKSHVLRSGTLYILGIFAVYFLIGLGVLKVLNVFNIPNFMAKIGAAAILGAGVINLIGDLFPRFPIKLKIPSSTHARLAHLIEKTSAPASLALGVLVGLFEFPCTGGPYLMVLGLLHDKITYFSGLLYLLYYDAIFVLPLALILLAASDKSLTDKVESLRREKTKDTRLAISLVMIGVGLLIFLI